MISTEARVRFLRPNCNGVNAKLKRRLSAKGSATIQGICVLIARTNTYPKLRNMITYRIGQTIPNRLEGGANQGFLSVE
jgi:hypothetical protein